MSTKYIIETRRLTALLGLVYIIAGGAIAHDASVRVQIVTAVVVGLSLVLFAGSIIETTRVLHSVQFTDAILEYCRRVASDPVDGETYRITPRVAAEWIEGENNRVALRVTDRTGHGVTLTPHDDLEILVELLRHLNRKAAA